MMNLFNLKQQSINFILNNRIMLAYLMAMSYICMHYFVSNARYVNDKNGDEESNNNFFIKYINDNNSNDKKIAISSISNSNKRSLYKRNFLIFSSSWTSSKKSSSSSSSSNSILLNKLLAKQQIIKIDEPQKNNDYNLRNKTSIFYSQILQDQILVHLLNSSELNQRNASYGGIYVEAGAFDGETWSNTLHLEKFKNWTGLLIEPSSENYKTLLNKNRKSYSMNSCLGQNGKNSLNSTYIEAGPFGITSFTALSSKTQPSSTSSIYSITCHPLAKLLDQFFNTFIEFKTKKSKISNQNTSKPIIVDYLSLDIEGGEKNTIETFPWDSYQFNLINIEFNQNKTLYNWIKSYMKDYGYIETVKDDVWYQDVYLAHKSIVNKLNLDLLNVSDFVKLFN
jgi:hypothetical protein